MYIPFLMLESHTAFCWCDTHGTDMSFGKWERHSSSRLAKNLLYLHNDHKLAAIQPEKLLWAVTTLCLLNMKSGDRSWTEKAL